jgi:hypothetical protein
MSAFRIGFLVLNSVQSSKWASFISSFQSYFRKIVPFIAYFKGSSFEGKYSTLTVSFVHLCNVGVRPCFEVLP